MSEKFLFDLFCNCYHKGEIKIERGLVRNCLLYTSMQKNGNFEFEIIELSKEKIPMCIGCFNCIKNGEKKCPHNSYIEPIVKKMEEADAFIITTPVYSMQVSGTLKNFIDHMSYNFHRPKFYNKKVLIDVYKRQSVCSI